MEVTNYLLSGMILQAPFSLWNQGAWPATLACPGASMKLYAATLKPQNVPLRRPASLLGGSLGRDIPTLLMMKLAWNKNIYILYIIYMIIYIYMCGIYSIYMIYLYLILINVQVYLYICKIFSYVTSNRWTRHAAIKTMAWMLPKSYNSGTIIMVFLSRDPFFSPSLSTTLTVFGQDPNNGSYEMMRLVNGLRSHRMVWTSSLLMIYVQTIFLASTTSAWVNPFFAFWSNLNLCVCIQIFLGRPYPKCMNKQCCICAALFTCFVWIMIYCAFPTGEPPKVRKFGQAIRFASTHSANVRI